MRQKALRIWLGVLVAVPVALLACGEMIDVDSVGAGTDAGSDADAGPPRDGAADASAPRSFCQQRGADAQVCDELEGPLDTTLWGVTNDVDGGLTSTAGIGVDGSGGVHVHAPLKGSSTATNVHFAYTSERTVSFVEAEIAAKLTDVTADLSMNGPLFLAFEEPNDDELGTAYVNLGLHGRSLAVQARSFLDSSAVGIGPTTDLGRLELGQWFRLRVAVSFGPPAHLTITLDDATIHEEDLPMGFKPARARVRIGVTSATGPTGAADFDLDDALVRWR